MCGSDGRQRLASGVEGVALDAVRVARVADLGHCKRADAGRLAVAGEAGAGLLLVDGMRDGGRGAGVGATRLAADAERGQFVGGRRGSAINKGRWDRQRGKGAVPIVVDLAGAVGEVGVTRRLGWG